MAPEQDATQARALEQAIARGQILGDSSNLARGFANEPSNVLTPQRLRRAGRRRSPAPPASPSRSWTRRRSRGSGMGLLLGVARGSAEPPRVIVLRHDPPGAPKAPVLGLVGKGITFDTGGISIKPAEGMERMKDDMAGGAAVICAMRAIALLKAPIRVVGVVPTTENMPGGTRDEARRRADRRQRQDRRGDQHRRGRAADSRATVSGTRSSSARRTSIDVATLTGACVVGLGKVASGLFGRPDAWRDTVRGVAQRPRAIAAGRCRCTTSTSTRSAARSPT